MPKIEILKFEPIEPYEDLPIKYFDYTDFGVPKKPKVLSDEILAFELP